MNTQNLSEAEMSKCHFNFSLGRENNEANALCKETLAILSLLHISDSLFTKCPEDQADPCFSMWGCCDGTFLHSFPMKKETYPSQRNLILSLQDTENSTIKSWETMNTNKIYVYQRKTRHTLNNLKMGSLCWTFPVKKLFMSTKLGKTISSRVFHIKYLENTNALENKVLQEEILISSYL